MIKPAGILVMAVLWGLNFQLNAQEITMGSLLEEMTNRESLARYPDWDWEEDAQMVWRGAEPGDVMIMRFQSPKAIPNVDLELQLTQSKNYGIVKLSVNGEREITVDGYAPEIQVQTTEIAGVEIHEGWNTVRVQIKGKNPKATGNVFGLDYLKVK